MSALLERPGGDAQVPLFFLLFLVVRGVPAMLLYRQILDLGTGAALAFFSATELPLVVAITTIAVAEDACESPRRRRWSGRRWSRPRSIRCSACGCAARRDDPEGV